MGMIYIGIFICLVIVFFIVKADIKRREMKFVVAGEIDIVKLEKQRDITGLTNVIHNPELLIRNPTYRTAAIAALGRIGGSEATQTLLNLLDKNEKKSRTLAIHALGQTRSETAILGLIPLLNDNDYEIQRIVQEQLIKIGLQVLEPLLTAQKQTPINGVNQIILAIGSPTVEPIIKALNNSDKRDRYFLIDALGRLKDKRAVTSLIQYLDDESIDVRCCAACALGEIGDVLALQPVIDALHKYDFNPCFLNALSSFSDPLAFKEIILSYHSTNNETTQKKIVELIEGFRNPCCQDCLIEALKDESRQIRKAALYTLGVIGNNGIVGPIIELKKTDDSLENDVNEVLEKLYVTDRLDHIEKEIVFQERSKNLRNIMEKLPIVEINQQIWTRIQEIGFVQGEIATNKSDTDRSLNSFNHDFPNLDALLRAIDNEKSTYSTRMIDQVSGSAVIINEPITHLRAKYFEKRLEDDFILETFIAYRRHENEYSYILFHNWDDVMF